MTMRTIVILVSLSFGVALGAIAMGLSGRNERPTDLPAAAATDVPAGGAVTGAEAEIIELRRRLNDEVLARQTLQKEVEQLREQVSQLDEIIDRETPRPSRRQRQAAAASATGQIDEAQLTAAGFDTERAAMLAQRLNQAEMERLYLRDRAIREGWIGTERYAQAVRNLDGSLDALRRELDEQSYDRLLFAMGRPNRVAVQAVIGSSPAQQIGLQAGDIIMSYDGKRLFNGNELRTATTEGQPGTSVPLEVLRDGQRLVFYIARGPLGVRLGAASARP